MAMTGGTATGYACLTVLILVGLSLAVVGVLWLLGLPGRRRERQLAKEWRDTHRAARGGS